MSIEPARPRRDGAPQSDRPAPPPISGGQSRDRDRPVSMPRDSYRGSERSSDRPAPPPINGGGDYQRPRDDRGRFTSRESDRPAPPPVSGGRDYDRPSTPSRDYDRPYQSPSTDRPAPPVSGSRDYPIRRDDRPTPPPVSGSRDFDRPAPPPVSGRRDYDRPTPPPVSGGNGYDRPTPPPVDASRRRYDYRPIDRDLFGWNDYNGYLRNDRYYRNEPIFYSGYRWQPPDYEPILYSVGMSMLALEAIYGSSFYSRGYEGVRDSVSSMTGANQYAGHFSRAGVYSAYDLVANGRTPEQRADLAYRSGVPYSEVRKAVGQADLMRVYGIGGHNSRLLVDAGINSMQDLARYSWDPTGLHDQLRYSSYWSGQRTPSLSEVSDWIRQARVLPIAIYDDNGTIPTMPVPPSIPVSPPPPPIVTPPLSDRPAPPPVDPGPPPVDYIPLRRRDTWGN